jgi:hypothetical protein
MFILLGKIQEVSFTMNILVGIFAPLQGFFNVMIYLRPMTDNPNRKNDPSKLAQCCSRVYACLRGPSTIGEKTEFSHISSIRGPQPEEEKIELTKYDNTYEQLRKSRTKSIAWRGCDLEATKGIEKSSSNDSDSLEEFDVKDSNDIEEPSNHSESIQDINENNASSLKISYFNEEENNKDQMKNDGVKNASGKNYHHKKHSRRSMVSFETDKTSLNSSVFTYEDGSMDDTLHNQHKNKTKVPSWRDSLVDKEISISEYRTIQEEVQITENDSLNFSAIKGDSADDDKHEGDSADDDKHEGDSTDDDKHGDETE